jgi:hypothetical protein
MSEESKPVILATLGFVRIRETLFFCGRNERPSQADWAIWTARQATPDFTLLLIAVDDQGPDAKQRSLVAEQWKKSGRPLPKTAILSNSAVMRGMITAFQWLFRGGDIKAFTRQEIGDALSWLGSSVTFEEAGRAMAKLQG